MVDFNIDEVILEASYKNKKGYIDINSTDDIKFLENIMYEMKYPSDFIDEYVGELMYENVKSQLYKLKPSDLNEGMLDSIKKFISTSWKKLKSFVGNSFHKAAEYLKDDYTFEEEYEITIPTQISENINTALNLIDEAGATAADREFTAKKGYYNESLVCKNIFGYKNKKNEYVVDIDEKYKSHIKEINSRIGRYKKEITDSNIIKEVKNGSESMTAYLLNTCRKNGTVIVGVFLSGTTTNVDEKKDISIVVRRGKLKKETVDKYSLKLYNKKHITLTNNTSKSLVAHLTSPDMNSNKETKQSMLFKEKIKDIELNNKKYKTQLDIFKVNSSKMRVLKKAGYDKNSKEVGAFREKRDAANSYRNGVYAEVVYDILKDFVKNESNKEIFIENLLRIIGFSDSETNLLIAIMDKKNRTTKQILDEHPKFDLSNITLKKPSRVQVVVNNGNDVIVIFGFKEGSSVTGIVSFSDVDPVDPEMWKSAI